MLRGVEPEIGAGHFWSTFNLMKKDYNNNNMNINREEQPHLTTWFPINEKKYSTTFVL